MPLSCACHKIHNFANIWLSVWNGIICLVPVSGVYGQSIPLSQFTRSAQESSHALANTEQVDAIICYLFIYYFIFYFLLGQKSLHNKLK